MAGCARTDGFHFSGDLVESASDRVGLGPILRHHRDSLLFLSFEALVWRPLEGRLGASCALHPTHGAGSEPGECGHTHAGVRTSSKRFCWPQLPLQLSLSLSSPSFPHSRQSGPLLPPPLPSLSTPPPLRTLPSLSTPPSPPPRPTQPTMGQLSGTADVNAIEAPVTLKAYLMCVGPSLLRVTRRDEGRGRRRHRADSSSTRRIAPRLSARASFR